MTSLFLPLLDNKLRLTTTPALTGNINTDIEIKCSVTSEPSASSRYAITWLLQQQAENKTIVSSDQDALVTFGPQVQLSHRQRISMRRTKGPSFEFSIRQARVSDNGLYVCEVVEWLQDPHGDWYQLSPVSKTTQLTVIEPGKFVLNSSLKMSPEFSKQHVAHTIFMALKAYFLNKLLTIRDEAQHERTMLCQSSSSFAYFK